MQSFPRLTCLSMNNCMVCANKETKAIGTIKGGFLWNKQLEIECLKFFKHKDVVCFFIGRHSYRFDFHFEEDKTTCWGLTLEEIYEGLR